MQGVVAAGSLATAQAAQSVLREGGNAVDAAVAAALAGFCAEPLLTSAGGAGVMLVRRGGELMAVDFFSDCPGAGGRPERLDFQAIEVDFGAARQTFHVGRAAAAVPMSLDGLAVAAQRFGTMELARLAAPAITLADEGIRLDAITARTFELLWQILARDPGCLAEIAEGLPVTRPPREGELLRNPNLARTLEGWAAQGVMPRALREGLLEEFGVARGGLLSAADLERATVNITTPHLFELDGWTVASSPRLGGRLVGLISEELAYARPAKREPDEVLRKAQASLAGHRARLRLPPPGTRGSTTHVSIVDANGDAAAVTLTSGEGCGHVVTGTGVHINNFLGEEDLNPAGFHMHRPGNALPTMIAPTIAVHEDGRVIALGSGGSNRIRSAVTQVLHGIVREGRSLAEAVQAPRVHAEEGEVWVELAGREAGSAIEDRLASAFPTVRGFAERDFFFGGVHVAARLSSGELSGFADPRRFGAVASA